MTVPLRRGGGSDIDACGASARKKPLPGRGQRHFSRDAGQEGSSSIQKDRLLVVDDDAVVRDMLEAMLETLGYHVISAENGFKAVETFQEKKEEICLVLSDVIMPGMDGWETLAALRAIQPDIPVILASGCSLSRTAAPRCREQPQAVLHKPFKMQDLKALLERVLNQDSTELLDRQSPDRGAFD